MTAQAKLDEIRAEFEEIRVQLLDRLPDTMAAAERFRRQARTQRSLGFLFRKRIEANMGEPIEIMAFYDAASYRFQLADDFDRMADDEDVHNAKTRKDATR